MAAILDLAKIVDDPPCLGSDSGFATKERHGVEIALQCNRITDTLPDLSKVCCPVQAHRITATGSDLFYPLRPTLGEDNGRHHTPFVFANKPFDDPACIGQR